MAALIFSIYSSPIFICINFYYNAVLSDSSNHKVKAVPTDVGQCAGGLTAGHVHGNTEGTTKFHPSLK